MKTGTLIGKSDKFISSAVHASISGRVAKIESAPHPILGEYNAITIDGDEKDALDMSMKRIDNIDLSSLDNIRDAIKAAGIVGLGGAAFPAHVKFSPPKNKPIDSVILNGAECEPYLTCDHRLMIEKSLEIIEGLKVIINP